MAVNTNNSPVTVITPVFNGAPFLQDCIDSVLSQTYRQFHYFIVDNCSSDRSLEIAEEAAAQDDRVTVVQSNEHVGVIQNWNRSLRALDDDSKYIKFVHADDWLFPDCIARMVALAEANDNVALVSAYRLEENRVTLDKLPSDAPLMPGIDSFTMRGPSVARAILLEKASVLGSPSSVLMRTPVLRNSQKFYNDAYLHADKDAALRLFRKYDFGFVRQVLVFTRRHNESVSSLNNILGSRRQENLRLLRTYGPEFLSSEEYRFAWKRELRDYYDFLAANVAVGHDAGFWDSHCENMRRAGTSLSRPRLMRSFVRRWTNPASSLKEILRARAVVASRAESQPATRNLK